MRERSEAREQSLHGGGDIPTQRREVHPRRRDSGAPVAISNSANAVSGRDTTSRREKKKETKRAKGQENREVLALDPKNGLEEGVSKTAPALEVPLWAAITSAIAKEKWSTVEELARAAGDEHVARLAGRASVGPAEWRRLVDTVHLRRQEEMARSA